MATETLRDIDWVRQAFLVRQEHLELVDQQNRTFTSASLKYTDTTPGGNFAINPPAQFTSTADIKAASIGFQNSKGLGRYYSEAIDDHNQIIHMRFGVPAFNSLSTFFTGFYDGKAGQLARTGRADKFFYALGKAAGFVVSIMSWKLLAVHLLGVASRFFLQKPSSKFYYLKPAMPLYWNAVTTIVNQIAVNRGIVPRVGGQSANAGPQYEFDAGALANLNNLLAKEVPDIFKPNGGIDVYAMANRAQRLERQRLKQTEQILTAASDMTREQLIAKIQGIHNSPLTDSSKRSFQDYLDGWIGTAQAQPKTESGSDASSTEELKKDETSNAGFGSFLEAELDDGGAFASFRVNATGPVQESFSNTVGESDLSNKLNSMSSQSRSANFSFANGNIAPGLDSVISGFKSFAGGVADSLKISGLAALGGAAFVDIPKHWQSSIAQLPRANYTINLTSPYGNPLSQLINIHIPLAMLLAGALPISSGKQSYTSPFLVELYDKGRCQTRLGMIDSLSITRGTGNLGFNSNGAPLAMEVTFSIVDMSTILHMPISEGFSMDGAATGAVVGGVAGAVVGNVPGAVVGAAAGTAVGATVDAVNNAIKTINSIFDDDTVFSDYMAILGSMGLQDQIYSFRRLKMNLTRARETFDSWYSVSHFASFAGDTFPGQMISALYRGTARN